MGHTVGCTEGTADKGRTPGVRVAQTNISGYVLCLFWVVPLDLPLEHL